VAMQAGGGWSPIAPIAWRPDSWTRSRRPWAADPGRRSGRTPRQAAPGADRRAPAQPAGRGRARD